MSDRFCDYIIVGSPRRLHEGGASTLSFSWLRRHRARREPKCPGPYSKCPTPTPPPPQQREAEITIYAGDRNEITAGSFPTIDTRPLVICSER